MIYGHAFLIYAVFFLSLALMVLSVKNRQSRRKAGLLYVLSLACSAYAMFTTEYFIGLELLRPIDPVVCPR